MQRFRRRDFEKREGLRPARFGTSLLLIVASIFAIAFGEDSSDWLRVLALVLEGSALLFILWTSDAHRRFLLVARISVVVSVFVASVVAIVGSGDAPSFAASLVGAFIAIGAPIAIVRRLARERVIDLQVLAGALCLYLLLGLFFTFIYGMIKIVDTGQLFVQQPNDVTSTANITYFSYVTMTTVGYGDLTLRGDVPRMVAVTEALIGQLYLVSAVALVVSRLGQERTRLRGGGGGGDATDGP